MTQRYEKAAIRSIVQERLLQMSLTKRKQQEEQIVRHLFALPRWQSAQTIALTKPMGIEINLDAVVKQACAEGKRLCLPVMQPQRQLQFVEWHEDTTFVRHPFGVEEPVNEAVVFVDEIELMIVPGLAYTPSGKRIGFGGGYYDRLLAQYPLETVSLAYDEQFFTEDAWVADTFDIPIRTIVTQKGVYPHDESLSIKSV